MAWYYTPMALDFTAHLRPIATVYDCMDELSAFAGAPPGLRDEERALLRRADVVFTGGRSLYEAKRALHPMSTSSRAASTCRTFARARQPLARSRRIRPDIAHPRIGFFGVIDERLDRDLLAGVADRCPGLAIRAWSAPS